jgi:hypothetical protein
MRTVFLAEANVTMPFNLLSPLINTIATQAGPDAGECNRSHPHIDTAAA